MTPKLEPGTTLYISPYQKHLCTGTPSYQTEAYRLEGVQKDFTMIRCLTCGKLFVRGSDAPEIKNKDRHGHFQYRLKTDHLSARPTKVRTTPKNK